MAREETPARTSRSKGPAAGRGRRDLFGAVLAWAFVVLLLASEAALSLPDETASDATVATFYA
jgi:hypothetical protein